MNEFFELRFDENSSVGNIIGLSASFSSMILALSQIPTMIRIFKQKNTGDLPILPYITMITTLSTYLGYGILTKDIALLIGPGFGTFVALTYLTIYLTYLSADKRTSVSFPLLILLIFLGVVVYCVMAKKELLIGIIAVISNIVYYFSPLVTVVKVCKTKSVDSMPFLFSFMAFISALIWLFYGFFVKEDIIIWGVCVVGITSSFIQLSCHCLFGCGRSSVNEETTVDKKTKHDKPLERMLDKV